MDYKLKIQGGRLDFTSADQRKSFEGNFRRAAQVEDRAARLRAVSQVILPPIRKVAPYLEWTQHFFAPRPEGPDDHVRIALDEYTVVAFMSSPDGGIEYTRPYRKYTTVSWRMIRCGLELPWDAYRWGWDVLSKKMMEAAEELARKRDGVRQPLLNAAAISQAGHVPTVSSVLTKASVDSILKSAAGNGFPVTMAAINTGTMMDMSGWTLPANSMISGSVPERVGRDILTRLFTPGYGDITWIVNHTIPSNYIYFGGPPTEVGWHFMGGVTPASDRDIDHDVDKHNWRQEVAAHLEGSHRIWRLEVT
jgi:hypothetical protein